MRTWPAGTGTAVGTAAAAEEEGASHGSRLGWSSGSRGCVSAGGGRWGRGSRGSRGSRGAGTGTGGSRRGSEEGSSVECRAGRRCRRGCTECWSNSM